MFTIGARRLRCLEKAMNQKDPTPEQRERHLARVRRYYSREKAEKDAARKKEVRKARRDVTKLRREGER